MRASDPIKINAVIQRGVNEDGVLDLVERFRGTGVTVRFIEYMDVGNRNDWREQLVVPSRDLQALIHARWPLRAVRPDNVGEVARRYAFEDGQGEVGFISSVTQPFCGACSRARLSSDGSFYTCLFAQTGTDLRAPLRAGADDAEMTRIIRGIWSAREDRYSEQRMVAAAARGRRPESRNELHRWLSEGRGAQVGVDAPGRCQPPDHGRRRRQGRDAPRRQRRSAHQAARGCGARPQAQRPPHEERTGVRHRHHRGRAGGQAHA